MKLPDITYVCVFDYILLISPIRMYWYCISLGHIPISVLLVMVVFVGPATFYIQGVATYLFTITYTTMQSKMQFNNMEGLQAHHTVGKYSSLYSLVVVFNLLHISVQHLPVCSIREFCSPILCYPMHAVIQVYTLLLEGCTYTRTSSVNPGHLYTHAV